MKFAKKDDKSTVFYNHKITLKDIPLAAYEYVVSGITNDANDWAIETMKNAYYPL